MMMFACFTEYTATQTMFIFKSQANYNLYCADVLIICYFLNSLKLVLAHEAKKILFLLLYKPFCLSYKY